MFIFLRQLHSKLSLAALVLLAGFASCAAGGDVRPAAVAGQFYPADAAELAGMVDGFLSNVPAQKIDGTTVAVLVPHAGYVYSGQVAAHSYALLNPATVTTVVLIGNSHHAALHTGAVYAAGAFATPLGTVPVNTRLARAILARTPLLAADTAPHKQEHSLEVQLPFLQRKLKNFSIVPILLGPVPLSTCREIGDSVAQAIREQGFSGATVIIASSDMSHYPSGANAAMADTAALKAMSSFDPAVLRDKIKGLMASSIPNESCVFCGEESVYTAMYAARALGATQARVLNYAHSGDVSGDQSRVVGYAAAVFVSTNSSRTSSNKPNAREAAMNDFSVTPENQSALLRIARTSIERHLAGGRHSALPAGNAQLNEPAAVFVTLTKNGELRGCIGTTEPRAALQAAVSQMAVAAAVEDYRFPPVTPEELKGIRIEISVLSPIKRISSPDEIQQNVHGVVVRKGRRGGLFLPQVWEHFKTKKDFMDELCRQKAGLDPDAWAKPGTELYVFTVFSFEEH